MRERGVSDPLHELVAIVFRVGAFLALGTIAIGYLLSIAIGGEAVGGSLLSQLRGGGPAAIVALGLFGLTLLPVGVVVALIIGFARSGERGRALTAAAVLLLLVASLLTAALLATAG